MKNTIKGPIEGHGHSGVKDLESYLAVHKAMMTRAEKSLLEVSDPIDAYVNHGRWLINCKCNGGGLTSPLFKVSCCFDCGRVYTNVVFPSNAEAIEESLLKRNDDANRNWQGESLDVVTAETQEKG